MVEEPRPRPREPVEAWRDAWSQTAVMLADHIPLMVGVALVVTVHKIRSAIMPEEIRSWTRVIDGALIAAEVTLFASLVLTKGIDLVGEVVEGLGIAWHRALHAFKKGKRLPPTPRL